MQLVELIARRLAVEVHRHPDVLEAGVALAESEEGVEVEVALELDAEIAELDARRTGVRCVADDQAVPERTEQLLDEHRDKVLAVAAALEERKTISGSDIAEIMGSDPGVLTRERPESWTVVVTNRAHLAVGNTSGMTAPGSGEAPATMDEPDVGSS